MSGMALDFGSVPDWVEAIGTSGALLILVGQFLRERGKERAAKEFAATAQRDEEARQARLVSVTTRLHYGSIDEEDEYGWKVVVQVINDSSEPIRNIEPFLMPRSVADVPIGAQWPDYVREAIRGAIRNWWAENSDRTVIRPGQQATLMFVPSDQPDEPGDPNDPTSPDTTRPFCDKYEIGATFTDAAGLRWSQVNRGQPIRELQGQAGGR
jgi:hypothetical protein